MSRNGPSKSERPADNPGAIHAWGLPNWACETAYGNTNDWNWFRWRWEFYRRRSDIREAFDERAEESYIDAVRFAGTQGVSADRILKPDQAGFTAQAYTNDAFGYHGVPNPRISEQPMTILGSCEPRPEQISAYMFWKESQVGETADPIPIGIDKISDVLLKFDLERPIRPQIKSAQRMLQMRQKMIFGKLLQKRAHTGKWLTYLRVLDAREAGASWLEIASILKNTVGTEQNARDTWEAANALRRNF